MADKSLGLPGRSRPAYPKRESGLGDQFMHWLNPGLYRERRTDDISAYNQEMKEYAAQKERAALAAFDSGQELTQAQRRALGETPAEQISRRKAQARAQAQSDDIYPPAKDTPFGVPYPGEVDPFRPTQEGIPQIGRPMDPSTFGSMPPQLGQDGVGVEGIPRTPSASPTERARNSRAFGGQQNARRSAQAFLNTSPDIQEAFHAERFGLVPPEIKTLAKGAIGIGPRGEVLAENPEALEVKSIVEQYKAQVSPNVPPGMTPEHRNGIITGRLVPITGGEKDPEVIKSTRLASLLERQPAAKALMDSALGPVDVMLATIGRLEGEDATLENPTLSQPASWMVGPLSDFFGGLTKFGKESLANARSDLKNLRNSAQLMGLQLMRNASKTGGAVGQVTEAEWPKLEAMIGNLDPTQGDDSYALQMQMIKTNLQSFTANLNAAYQSEFNDVLDQTLAGEETAEPVVGTSTEVSSGDIAIGTKEDGYTFLGGDPANPDNWRED